MMKIDKELFEWIVNFDENEHIYAKYYGSFSLSRMDFNIYIDDEEIERFDEAEKIILENDGIAPSNEVAKNYYRYIQAHNHELFHYYQAFVLPAFNIYQKIFKVKTELEASTMLRYFEQGYSYTIGKNRSIFDVFNNSNYSSYISQNDIENFNNIISKYKFFTEQWVTKYKEVSLFYIIEGMAHIMSIQLTPYAKNYLDDTDKNPEYNRAYEVFNSYIDLKYQNIDIRVKHLLFLYICYFACHLYSLPNEEYINKTSRLFYILCSRLNNYIDSFEKLRDRYIKYSEEELRQLNQFELDNKDILNANKNQIAHIYALFELIPCIQQDAEKFYNKKIDLSLDIPNEFLNVFKILNINLFSIYQLANFALFPNKMADMWEAYDEIQKLQIGENQFDVAGESGFFELIGSCKNILNNSVTNIPCCSEHGNINNKLQVLYCYNEGSFAYYLKELTNREAIDLFKISEVL